MLSKANFQNKPSRHQWWIIVSAALLIINIWYIVYNLGQNDFFFFFPFYTLAFLGWIWMFRFNIQESHLYIIGILARLGLLFAFPSFSDDIFRFYWDGKLSISGISPFGVLPTDILEQNIPYLDKSLFDQLNSQNYYTIYPPVNQLFFAIAAAFGDVFHAGLILKILFVIAESTGLFFILKMLKNSGIPIKSAGIYFLNPLVIIEGVGNLHFEVMMIAFLCISLFYIFKNNVKMGALFMALSIGIKLLPLMILPYFLFSRPYKEKWKFFGWLGLFLIIIFLPMANGIHISSYLNSVDLYFRKFEFNASVYYVLRFLGKQMTGYNLIKYMGPALGLITIGFNLYLAKRTKAFNLQDFGTYALLCWTAYLILATTVHPWYVISLLFFSLFSPYSYPLIWTYIIIISYTNYSNTTYYENPFWILLEYVILFTWMFWEWQTKKHQDLITLKA